VSGLRGSRGNARSKYKRFSRNGKMGGGIQGKNPIGDERTTLERGARRSCRARPLIVRRRGKGRGSGSKKTAEIVMEEAIVL